MTDLSPTQLLQHSLILLLFASSIITRMQNFHRFIASRQRQGSSLSNQFSSSNQQNKQSMNNEDEKYLMQVESEKGENGSANDKGQQQQDSVDPLDAYMTNLQQQVVEKGNKATNKGKVNSQKLSLAKQSRENQLCEHYEQFLDEQQLQRPNFIQHQNNSSNQSQPHSYQGEICENNDDQHQEIIDKGKSKKVMQTLKPFDFSTVELEDFEKDFYDQHSEIAHMTEDEVKKYRKDYEIKVTGEDVPKPIISFGHLELDDSIKQVIIKQQFEKPTPIQSQALPIALKGRDLIGVAKTGSGKTLAYVWPMITHVGHQRDSRKGEGPVGLVLAPTRQLCQQIYLQTKKYTKKYDIKVACLLGGENKHQQWKQMKSGVDILIASPGRLIEMIKKRATSLIRVTFLVLDQADKMLSLGFEQQIRSIVSQTRPDRQTLLFTATMKKAIQFLAYDILDGAIKVLVGDEQAANENVRQVVVVIQQEEEKLQWLKTYIAEFIIAGKTLIFCNHKQTCQHLAHILLTELRISSLTLHGSKSQYQRTTIMNSFKSDSQSNILIATDIASRGIDVKNIKTVINYECPSSIEAYIHRIGRAGRAGESGEAFTLLKRSQKNAKFAIQLIKVFENSGYPVTKQLEDLACLDDFYRRKRISSKMGVSFAKGKDASKFLNQILKQQQKGNSKAGLGMNQTIANNKKYQRSSWGQNERQSLPMQSEKSIAELLNDKNMMGENMSISELSKIIKQMREEKAQKNLSSTKLRSHFVKFTQNNNNNQPTQDNKPTKEDEVTISFYKKRN